MIKYTKPTNLSYKWLLCSPGDPLKMDVHFTRTNDRRYMKALCKK